MNWILGIIGAFVGGALMAGYEPLAGAALGFFVLFLLGSLSGLRDRVGRAEAELAKLRQQLAGQVAARAAEATRPVEPAPVAAPRPSEAAAIPVPTPSPASVAEAAPTPVAARTEAPAPAAPPPRTTAVPPPRVARPKVPAEPNAIERAVEVVKRWFTEGNVPVKVGMVVLLFGVGAALKYASDQGYVSFPIELRYAAIAALGVAALAFGWRERKRNPAFGLSLQGGAIGILLLTVFAAFRLHPLLDSKAAFALIVLLVAGSVALALLQNAMALAVLGFLGGYLAPVLLSTGSGNYVALFSYYAVLNAAVFAVSWKRAWRPLNLLGFAFTFGVGTAWGVKYYRPEMFATVEPFLILFFVFYVVIGLLYVLRQAEHRKPWVDGTLVFGTPLLAFPLQAGLLKDDRMGLALSALAVALVYVGLLAFLRRRKGERLLTEAYGALAIGFATLAVPLAFNAGTTAGVWALEGVAIAWLGIRQNSTIRWLAGLGLQLFAAISYLIGFAEAERALAVSALADAGLADSRLVDSAPTILLLNPQWLGAAILAISGFALSLIHDRRKPVAPLPLLLFLWATGWWFFGGIGQADRAEATIGSWQFAILYLAITAAAAALLREHLDWRRMNWLVGGVGLLGVPMVFIAGDEFSAPLQPETLPGWGTYAAAMLYALWQARASTQRSLAVGHLALLWTLALALTFQLGHVAEVQELAQGWEFLAVVAPAALLSLVLWRAPAIAAWPRVPAFGGYAVGWFAPVFVLLAIAWILGVFADGEATPLVYLPLLNPLELGLVGVAGLMYAYAREHWPRLRPMLRGWPFAGFVFVTLATLRAVHHWHGEPWGDAVLDSGFSQTALTLVWSVIGVLAWIFGSRRVNRPLWMGGAVLMAIVLAKLIGVDRTYTGDVAGIVSFMVVGLLMVGVGYIAPSPPKQPRAPDPEDAEAPPPTAPIAPTSEAT